MNRPPVAAPANTANGRWLRRARLTNDPAGDLIAEATPRCRASSVTPTSCAHTCDREGPVVRPWPPCQSSGGATASGSIATTGDACDTYLD